MAKTNSQVSSIDDQDSNPNAVEATVEVKEVRGANHDDELSGKFEVVTIHGDSTEGGSDAVFVSHNGFAYQIPRDTPSKVPTEVAQVLRDARTTTYTHGKDGAVIEQSRPRFAFSSQPA